MKKERVRPTGRDHGGAGIPLASFFGRRWEVRFDEPELTSDGGLAAVAASGVGEGLVDALADAVADGRRAPIHGVREILSQRVHAIMSGYHGADDSDHLRHDPVVGVASGRAPGVPLASQPTVSRFENMAGRADIYRMSEALLGFFLDSFGGEAPPMVCIDMDPSAHLIYGQQELGLFNAHVGDTCLMPFYVFDGCTGRIMAAVLREGAVPRAGEVLALLKRLVAAVRSRFPATRIMLRADSHHTKPAVMEWMEAQRDGSGDEVGHRGVEFATALQRNPVLGRIFGDAIAAAESRRDGQVRATGDPGAEHTAYAEVDYAAKSWVRHRRVIARITAGPQGVDVRYVVTSLEAGSPQYIYRSVYCGRGQAELFIRECKSLGSDTSPCTSATANAFRLLLHAAAYAVLHRFREIVLAGTRWARAMLATIQLRLIKVAARVVTSARKVVLHLGRGHPPEIRGIWRRAACVRAPG
jgi:hypothetical protein